ncbi:S41 family peptidase [Peribacillus alkalitolerans]|uniref:S41 family peptidase n=1 Tax=Peribacillus alkalitolerans TaxID=1550385 RepID=UPI0013D23077|nr:S41 family peptidase [Peribacillus alkalitolerans]
MKNKQNAIFLFIVLLSLTGGVMLFQKRDNPPPSMEASVPIDSVETSYVTHEYVLKDETGLFLENWIGNVEIKPSTNNKLVVNLTDRSEKSDAFFTIKDNGNQILIGQKGQSKADITILVPTSIQDIGGTIKKGNWWASLPSITKLNLKTEQGNVSVQLDKLDLNGEYILVSEIGAIAANLPEGSRLKLVAPADLVNVEESPQGVKFFARVVSSGMALPVLYSGNLTQEDKTEELLQPEDMKKDLDLLFKSLEQKHYVYQMRTDEILKQQSINKITEPMSKLDFFHLITDILVTLHDGHTNITGISTTAFDIPKVFWGKDGILVTEDDGDFRKGDEIISVGGKTKEELFLLAKQIVPADHEGWIYAVGFERLTIKQFAVKKGLISKEQTNLPIVVKRGKKIKEISVKERKVSDSSLEERLFSQQVKPPYHWKIKKGMGIFTLNQSVASEGYRESLREFFKEVQMRKVKKIAVDLRENNGGSDLTIDWFIAHLNVDQYKNIGDILTPNEKVPDIKSFDGQVYIFTSQKTFSAGSNFATVIKANSLGEILGQSPGNNGSFGGNIHNVYLEQSGFKVVIPTSHARAPLPPNEQNVPIKPDVEIEWTKTSLLEKSDPWLDAIQ